MAARRMARAQAVISPTVSPRRRMAVTAAATWAGVGSPLRQAAKNASASFSVSAAPSASLASSGLKASDIGAGLGLRQALDAREIEEVGEQVMAAFGLGAVHRASDFAPAIVGLD